MSLNYKSIGKHIREIRQRNHLSQAMLSELVDKTPSYISYIESGIKSMSLDTFVLIANALGVSPDQLLLEQITCSEQCASEEITLLLSDCTTYEMLILMDVLKTLKTSLKEHQGRYGKPDNFDFTTRS
jgi:transcriptional regulator with XRE-family HTH domain